MKKEMETVDFMVKMHARTIKVDGRIIDTKEPFTLPELVALDKLLVKITHTRDGEKDMDAVIHLHRWVKDLARKEMEEKENEKGEKNVRHIS